MRSHLLLAIAALCVGYDTTLSQAESPPISIVSGTIEKADKGVVVIAYGGRPKRVLELKITGTSNIRILAPQIRAGKTIVTQRNAEPADLVPGQEIAAIYTLTEDAQVLLSGVAKPAEKEKEK